MDERSPKLPTDSPLFAEMAEALGLGMAFQILAPADGSRRRFTYIAPSCLAMNGVTAEAALADNELLYNMILPEHREVLLAAEQVAAARRESAEVEVRMRRADGEIRWRRIKSASRPLPDGSWAWDGLMTDITEAKRVAAELDSQRQRLQVAVEATGLGFWQWDLETNGLVWSERNKAIFGLSSETPVSVPLYLAMIHPDDLERCREVYRAARDNPGGDFALEYRAVVPSGQIRWIVTRGRVVTDENGRMLVVGTTLDATERHAAEERRSLVMSELAHRSKNAIQVTIAIIQETARHARDVGALEEALLARLEAMAQSQDLVTASGGRPVRLHELAEVVFKPFNLARIDLDPRIAHLMVDGEVAASLALLFHEMATNAVKYGALSAPHGRVALEAADAGPGMAALRWRECGGPPVRPENQRRGFGSRLLQAALRPQGGKVEASFEPEGFAARMEFQVTK